MKNKTLFIGFLLALMSSACIPLAGRGYDGPTNPQPGQTLAVQIILSQISPNLIWLPPPIVVHFNDNCSDSSGNYGPQYGTPGAFKNPDGGDCLYGIYNSSGWIETSEFQAPDRIDLEWHGSFSNSTFSHEICHAWRQYYFDDDGDPNHDSNCFSVPGDHYTNDRTQAESVGSLVANADAALAAAGF